MEPVAPAAPVDREDQPGLSSGRTSVRDEGPGSPGKEGEGGLTRPRRARAGRTDGRDQGRGAGHGQVGHADVLHRGVGLRRPQLDPADEGDVDHRVRTQSDALRDVHRGGWAGHGAGRHRTPTAVPANGESGRCRLYEHP